MRNWTHLIRFISVEDGQEHLGQLENVNIDVGIATQKGQVVKARLIEGDIFSGEVTDTELTVKRLLCPIRQDQCPYIRCSGLNYKNQAEEAGVALPDTPILFSKPRTALAGPFPDTINIPKIAQDGSSDYEAVLCAVLGKTGKNIPEFEALNYVLGYTASNDVSARFLQYATSQWCFSKGFDSSCPIGPVIVSPAAIKDPQNLSIKAIYNGKTVQDGNTRDMVFSIAHQIAFLSKGTTLEAGSILLTGTPAGIGYTRKPRVTLQNGGEIKIEIEGIGSLVNKVRFES